MNKRALITGSNRGLGRAIAEVLLDRGARVAALNRSAAKLDGLHEETCDLRYPGAIEVSVDRAVDWLEGLDVCILNAAVRRFSPIELMPLEAWQESIDVNITANFIIARRVMSELRRTRGHMVIIGSQASDHQFEGGVAYCATKAALKALASVAMMEGRPEGVRTTIVTAGAISNRPKEADAWKIRPIELARLIVDLLFLPSTFFVSEIEIRPTAVPAAEVTGLERMHRL